MRRLADVVVSGVALVVLSPLIGLAMLAVRPWICAQPVRPGLMASRPRWRSVYWATWTWIVGRGPMIDISPRRTLTRLGSSSIDQRRRNLPTRVIRASPSLTAMPAPMLSAPLTIVRSLSMSNSRPSLPTRRWR